MAAEVRTRFAPSPTGFLHVGGVRTTVFAWLLARHFGGKFILRIEDTDRERLVPGAIKGIMEDLEWLGLDIDEGPSAEELKKCDAAWDGTADIGGPYGPYVQSQRLERYREAAEFLIEKGFAYRCDCTPEMLKKEREEQMARRELPGYSGYCRTRNVSPDSKHVVRFKMPPKCSLVLDDAVKGKISWDGVSLRDTVILKSDGFPTYHLAVVVDDHHMKISHVMRGEEWISTTPLHLLLYEAFGWERPVFCHLPSVMGADGKKLSKRHGATHVSAFRERGYLPEALLNFLILIGWSPGEGDEQEIFSRSEMIEKFSLDHVNSAAGVFAYNKLDWMNGVYIRNLSDDEFCKRARPFVEQAGIALDEERYRLIMPHVKERIKLFPEVPALIDFLFTESIDRDYDSMFKRGIDREKALSILKMAKELLEGAADFEVEAIEREIRKIPEALGIKVGPAFTVVRIAVTGKKVTPPLFESMHALGFELCLQRLEEAISEVSAMPVKCGSGKL